MIVPLFAVPLVKKYPANKLYFAATLTIAGSASVKTDHHKSKPWLTVLAQKAPYDGYDESDDTRETARTVPLLKQNL